MYNIKFQPWTGQINKKMKRAGLTEFLREKVSERGAVATAAAAKAPDARTWSSGGELCRALGGLYSYLLDIIIQGLWTTGVVHVCEELSPALTTKLASQK